LFGDKNSETIIEHILNFYEENKVIIKNIDEFRSLFPKHYGFHCGNLESIKEPPN